MLVGLTKITSVDSEGGARDEGPQGSIRCRRKKNHTEVIT